MNSFKFPETIECPECGGTMDLMMDGDYSNKPLTMVYYGIYHCDKCDYDHIIEKKWELVEVSERRYFHG